MSGVNANLKNICSTYLNFLNILGKVIKKYVESVFTAV